MSENMNNTTAETTETPVRMTAEEWVQEHRSGIFKISAPMISRDVEYDELKYDFSKLTGREFVNAMDSDIRPASAYKISHVQALNLFGLAVQKSMPGIFDATDVVKQLPILDVPYATGLTMDFFQACLLAGSRRITRE